MVLAIASSNYPVSLSTPVQIIMACVMVLMLIALVREMFKAINNGYTDIPDWNKFDQLRDSWESPSNRDSE